MNKLQFLAAVLLTSASMIATGQTSATVDPPPPATQNSGAPLTKKEMKEQKKEQKHQEKAAKESAKAQKSSADALKHQDKAKDEQEKISSPQ